MEKFLITGFSGFVSRYFLDYLEKNDINAHVLGVDLLSPHFDIRDYKRIKCSFEKVDLLDKNQVDNIIYQFQPEYILHLASYSSVAKIPTDGVPHALFYLAGIIAWNYFSSCLSKTSDTFYANAGIFGKVYFPRLSVPLSVVITNLITFAIQFVVFGALLVFFYFKGFAFSLHWSVALLPLLILQMAALGLGAGIIVSSLTTRYRDFTYLLSFGIQLWMYASPVVYPLSQVPEKWRAVYLINPMASVIETFKFMFLGVGGVNFGEYAIGLAVTVVLLATGIILFSRIEKTFMDTI